MYSVSEVARAVGRAPSTVQKWIAVDKYVTPAICALGTGDRHRFDDRNVQQLRAVSAIVTALGDGEAARSVIERAVAQVKPNQTTLTVQVEITL